MAVNDVSAFRAQIWSDALIPNIDQTNVMLQLTNRQFEGQLNNIGDTIQVRTLGNINTAQYIAGTTDINYQGLSPTLEPFQVSDAFYWAYSVDDIEKIQNDMDLLMRYASRGTVASNNNIEAKIMAAVPSGANTANIISSSGSAITLDSTTATTGIYYNITLAGVRLSKLSVPEEDRWMVLNPADVQLIQLDTAHFIRATEMGDQIVRWGGIDGQPQEVDATKVPGLVGECSGFKIFKSNVTPFVGAARCLPYGQGTPIAYISMLKEMNVIQRERQFGTAMRALFLHDTKVFNEEGKRLGYILAA